jgi:hypothetical protein
MKSITLTIRLPKEVDQLAERQADAIGVSKNKLLAHIITAGLGVELAEPGVLSRLMAEIVIWMGQHGGKGAPVAEARTTLAALKALKLPKVPIGVSAKKK